MKLSTCLAKTNMTLDDLLHIIEWGQIFVSVVSDEDWDDNALVEVPIHQLHDLVVGAQEMYKGLEARGDLI